MKKRTAALAALLVLLPGLGWSEQSISFGPLEVHYVLLASTFLEPEVAARYNIVRARDRGLVNLTVLSGTGAPRTAQLHGVVTNLLGQRIELSFDELRDGPAIYYIASFRYTDAELLRFEIDVATPDEGGGTLRIEQKLSWD